MSFEEAKDVGVEYIETSSHASMQTDEEKALVRKIDLCLLPTIWLMYLLSYMDVCSILSLVGYKTTAKYICSAQTSAMQK